MSGVADAVDPIRVLNISGYSRSGSTLLLRMLGQLPGVVPVGEVWHIWRRSFGADERCGCGKPFRRCEFWAEVVRQAFGGVDGIDARRMSELQASLQIQQRPIPALIRFLRTSSYRETLREYHDGVAQLYRTIQRVSAARLIVDSTKIPSNALTLAETPGIELHVVHLVRDSRATAHSWQRAKIASSLTPRQVALGWLVSNTLLGVMRRRFASYRLLRYEDFVRSPRASVTEIAAQLGVEAESIETGVGADATVFLPTHHTVSGNPNRFETGAIAIAPDDEWQTQMPPGQKRLVLAMTWPLLWRFGYLGSPRRASVAVQR